MAVSILNTRTGKVYLIFLHIVHLNQYRFKDMNLDEVIDDLIDFTAVDPSYISRKALENLIAACCDKYDTGICFERI